MHVKCWSAVKPAARQPRNTVDGQEGKFPQHCATVPPQQSRMPGAMGCVGAALHPILFQYCNFDMHCNGASFAFRLTIGFLAFFGIKQSLTNRLQCRRAFDGCTEIKSRLQSRVLSFWHHNAQSCIINKVIDIPSQ